MPRPPDALIARYRTLIATYGDRTARRLVGAWDALGSYGEDDIARYADQVAPSLAGAKNAAVATSAAFFAHAHRIRPVGVDPAEVLVEPKLADPFHAMWHAISMGRVVEDALGVGASVAEATALDFVTSVARRSQDNVAAKAGIRTRWERVPSASACEWCDLVSGQTYLSAETADFGHDRCSCTVVPTEEVDATSSSEAFAVSDTTPTGEGRRALGITSHHPR